MERHVLLFLLALAGVSALIRELAPAPPGGGLAVKWAAYREQAQEIDLLVLGTSRLARGLVPAVLDAELARRGHPLRSFNLAVLGMNTLEADYLLDEALAVADGRLTHVLLEVDSWRPALPDESVGLRARDIHYHDLRRTFTALESLWVVRRFGAPLQLLEVALVELERFWIDRLSLGRGAWWIARLFDPPRDPLDAPSPEQARTLRGHHPYPEPRSEAFLRRQELAAARGETSRFDRLLAAARAPTELDRDTRPYNRAALRRQIERVRAAGAEPLYLAPPSVKTRAWIGALHAEGALPNLFDFSAPDEHPELFDLAKRYDVDHLNQAGAEAFSRELAARIAAHLDARSGAR